MFDPNKDIRITYRASSIALFIDAIKRYLKYLQPLRKKDNESIEKLYREALNLGKYLTKRRKEASDEWDTVDLYFEARGLVLIKSALAYEKNFAEKEKAEKLSQGNPVEAVEFLNKKIAKITELEGLGQMADVPVEKIMGEFQPTDVNIEPRSEPLILDDEIARITRTIGDDESANGRAVDDAATVLESRIRTVADLPNSDFGSRLVKKAFNKIDGFLILSEEANEQDGYHKLYDGFLSALKNPLSHRVVAVRSDRAKQLIQFADYLVGLLNSAKRRPS